MTDERNIKMIALAAAAAGGALTYAALTTKLRTTDVALPARDEARTPPPAPAAAATPVVEPVPARRKKRLGLMLATGGSLIGLAVGACTHVTIEVALKEAGLEGVLEALAHWVQALDPIAVMGVTGIFAVGVAVGAAAVRAFVTRTTTAEAR